MSKLLLTGAIALVMTTGMAVAQTTSSETTTTVRPAPGMPASVAPPPGTLSVTRTDKTTTSDGVQTDKTESTYRNTNGVADDTVSRTTTYPPPVASTTSTSSKSTTTTTE
jgi:hypothetical protein